MYKSKSRFLWFDVGLALVGLVLSIAGCTVPAGQAANAVAGISDPTVTTAATLTPEATWTAAPSETPRPAVPADAPTATPAVEALQVCSPLSELGKAELLAAVSNPYHPPAPGSDDPHHGVDLAVQQYGMALAGAPVQAALAGEVAMVLKDRFPYGNAVLVETRLSDLPAEWLAGMQIPTPAPTLAPNPALTCPAADIDLPAGLDGERSLYLLYAHLGEAPDLQVGQQLACGAPLGKVGQSGNALNPHLHLEIRSGPGGARLESLAHYDNSASLQEMGRYCLWRVSGVFQLVDPNLLLKSLP